MKLRYEGTTYNNEVYRLVPKNTKVLDIGCNTGYLGEALINKKDCYVFGIDFSREALKIAKKKLNKTKRFDLEKYQNPRINEKFDVIIFADVLEHVRYPKRLLNIYKNLLSEKGIIIASVPNVANIKNRFNLFCGNWDYTRIGILDETHLRFFTKKTAMNLFKKSGYKPTLADYTSGFSFLFFRYFEALKKIRKILCGLNKNLFALQFIIIAKPRIKKIKI